MKQAPPPDHPAPDGSVRNVWLGSRLLYDEPIKPTNSLDVAAELLAFGQTPPHAPNRSVVLIDEAVDDSALSFSLAEKTSLHGKSKADRAAAAY